MIIPIQYIHRIIEHTPPPHQYADVVIRVLFHEGFIIMVQIREKIPTKFPLLSTLPVLGWTLFETMTCLEKYLRSMTAVI